MAFGLTIESQSLDIDGAWRHNRSLRRVLSTIETRGDSRIVPTVDGRTPYLLRRDEAVIDLELMVFGLNDQASTPYADVIEGLHANLAYLTDFVVTGLANVTLGAVLELTDGTTYESEVQILNWHIMKDDGTKAVVSYDLRVPSGVWTESAS